ncbi:MAG: sigma-54 dependent transcriptional regulator [Pseudomonadota bacterium]
MPDVLIIDDDEQICKMLSKIFQGMGYTTHYQQTLQQGVDAIFSGQVDIVFLDVNLPDGNGLEAIDVIRRHPLAPEIIIITADENIDGAELAMRARAWDYISKKGSHKNFKFALDRAYEYRKQKLARQPEQKIKTQAIVGQSRLLLDCLEKAAQAARTDIPVMISGETGTGKELFAKAIHDNSKRSQAEFVVVDCASLPEHLVESALFGHTKGAFTGADSDKTGLMKMADKGSLFLDEVGELPLIVQKKFLRALQEKKFRPIGAKNEVSSDFRVICATHRDLSNMVKQGSFREDLFFRLFTMDIHLPPLKDREKDVSLLAGRHLIRKKDENGKPSCRMSPEFLEELELYDWPGNVRELINTLDLVCSENDDGTTLFPHHLPEYIRAHNIRKRFSASPDSPIPATSMLLSTVSADTILTYKDHLEKLKYDYLQTLLSAADGNIKTACSLSGLSRGHLYRLLQQHDMKIT